MPPALWGPPLRRGTGSKKPSSSRNGAHSSSVAARLRAPPRQQRRTGRAGAKGTSWRLRFLPCPSAPTALLCVSRTEAARRGRAAHVAQNGGRGERGGPPRPGPAHPLPGVAVPGADDGSRLLDHLQHGAAVHVARDVGVVGAHDPAEAALSRGGVPPRHAAPRRAVPDAGDVSTWRALPARHRGNRPVPAALGPPPARRRASVPSRRQRGTPRHQLHPGPIPAAPLRPAPPGACGAPRGRLKGTGTGRPAASDPQRDGTGRRYLETWMVAGPGPAAPRSDMAAPAPASNGAAAAAALNRDRPPRPAPPRAAHRAPHPPRPCAGGGAAAVPAGTARGRCGERRCAAARGGRNPAAPRAPAAAQPAAPNCPSRSGSASRRRWSRCCVFSHASAAAEGRAGAHLALLRPPAAREAPRRAPAQPGLQQLPADRNRSPGAAGTEVVPPPRPALPCPRAAPSALLPRPGRALTATLRSRRSCGAPDPRNTRISHAVPRPGVSLPPPVRPCAAQPQSCCVTPTCPGAQHLHHPPLPRTGYSAAIGSRAHPRCSMAHPRPTSEPCSRADRCAWPGHAAPLCSHTHAGLRSSPWLPWAALGSWKR